MRIPAAGTVPWRLRDGILEVALVHRPRYDDWSWAKGKLDPGEDWAVAAVRLLGLAERRGARWRVTEFGAVWMHRLQQLFSITYIDEVWAQCQAEAWPREVVLS